MSPPCVKLYSRTFKRGFYVFRSAHFRLFFGIILVFRVIL